jgi:PEP-CTERM motif
VGKSLIAASLLIFAIGTAGAAHAQTSCPSNPYTGNGPTLQATLGVSAVLCTDHPIYSASGVYSAELQDSGVFAIWRGSNVLVNSNVQWTLPLNGNSPYNVPANSFTARLQDDGNFVISGPNNNLQLFVDTGNAQSSKGNYFATLNDNGSFVITAGTPAAPGKQVYSNNVNNPVVGITLSSLNYEEKDAQIIPTGTSDGGSYTGVNNTSRTQTYNPLLSLTHTDTQTFSWNASASVALTISETATEKVPTFESSTTVSFTGTAMIQGGKSTTASQAVTDQLQADIVVPADSTYRATIIGQEGEVDVPYTFTGTALYKNGQTAFVSGSGEFDGVSTAAFTVVIDCVSSPTNCKGFIPEIESPSSLGGVRVLPGVIPEPSTWAMMLAGFTGLGFIGYRRTRRARRQAA